MKKIFTILLAAIAMGFLGGCSDGGDTSSRQVSAPTGLSASAKSSTSVRLRWNPVEGASCYNIQYNDGYSWTSEGSPAYTNECTVSDLQPYTNYSFQVRTVGRSNTSEWSSTKSARTWIEAPSVLATKSGTTVTLIIAPVKGAASYGVNYGTTSDRSSSKYFTNARPVNDGSIEPVKITGLTAGKTYYFFVTPMPSGTSKAEYAMISVSL